MNVRCPSCGAEMDVDVLLAHEESRAAMLELIALSVPMALHATRYLRLFKPSTRALSMARTVSLLGELVPDMQRQAITLKGRDWAAPHETWRRAFDLMLARRDEGKLKLPLTTHGYLYEVLCGLADEAEAAAERDREQQRRERRDAPAAGPMPAADAAAEWCHPDTLTERPVPARQPAPSGPSIYVRKLQAEIAARRAAAQGNGGGEEAAAGGTE